MTKERKVEGSHTHSCVCCLRYVTSATDSVVEYHSVKLDITPEME